MCEYVNVNVFGCMNFVCFCLSLPLSASYIFIFSISSFLYLSILLARLKKIFYCALHIAINVFILQKEEKNATHFNSVPIHLHCVTHPLRIHF